jgi:hypothetical protein
MPKKDYNKTVIYCIKHKDDFNNENVSVGSTTNFMKRKNKHKSDCNCETSKSYNQKLYQHIRNNGSWENWVMYELEKYPCNDKRECETRERYWYDKMNATLNSIKPRLTDEEISLGRYNFDPEYRNRQLKSKRERYHNDPDYRINKIKRALARYYATKNELNKSH